MTDVTLDGFELIEKIGEGGMGQVWKARQLSLDRLVAIKLLPPRLSHDPESIRQIFKEARTAAKLKHPGIVHVYDASERDGHCCLVMEFIDGYNVGQWISRKKVLSYRDALVVIESVVIALKYAWNEAGLIHCDLKPENIKVDHDCTIKVADLGLSLTRDSQGVVQASDEIAGTPGYISPEQVHGDVPLDCRTDIYALGCCLYHMVTGERPFRSLSDSDAMEAQVSSQIPDPREIVSEVPASVCGLIEWMLIKNRDHRLADWDAVLKELHKVQKSSMFTREMPPEGTSTMRRRVQSATSTPDTQKSRKHSFWSRAAIILAVGAAIGVAIHFGQMWWIAHRQKQIAVRPVTLVVTAATNEPTAPVYKAPVPPPNHKKDIDQTTARIKATVDGYITSGKYAEGIDWLVNYSEGYASETLRVRKELEDLLKAKKMSQDEAVQAETSWTNYLDAIISCVCSGKYSVACQMVNDSLKDQKLKPHQAELASMAHLLEDVGSLPDKMLKSYEPDIGRNVIIPLVRGPFMGHLIAIRDRKLILKTMDQSAQIDLRLEEIAPTERQARLVTLDLPEAYFIRGVAAYNAGKDVEAEAFLNKTGSVLGPMLIARRKASLGANPQVADVSPNRGQDEDALRDDPAFLAFSRLVKIGGIDLAQYNVSKMRNAIESAPLNRESAIQADRAMDLFLEAHGTSVFAEKHADLILAFQSACGKAMRQK